MSAIYRQFLLSTLQVHCYFQVFHEVVLWVLVLSPWWVHFSSLECHLVLVLSSWAFTKSAFLSLQLLSIVFLGVWLYLTFFLHFLKLQSKLWSSRIFYFLLHQAQLQFPFYDPPVDQIIFWLDVKSILELIKPISIALDFHAVNSNSFFQIPLIFAFYFLLFIIRFLKFLYFIVSSLLRSLLASFIFIFFFYFSPPLWFSLISSLPFCPN